jgi:hypothetical protein
VPDASNLMDSGKVPGSGKDKRMDIDKLLAGLEPAELTAAEVENWHQLIDELTRREG